MGRPGTGLGAFLSPIVIEARSPRPRGRPGRTSLQVAAARCTPLPGAATRCMGRPGTGLGAFLSPTFIEALSPRPRGRPGRTPLPGAAARRMGRPGMGLGAFSIRGRPLHGTPRDGAGSVFHQRPPAAWDAPGRGWERFPAVAARCMGRPGTGLGAFSISVLHQHRKAAMLSAVAIGDLWQCTNFH